MAQTKGTKGTKGTSSATGKATVSAVEKPKVKMAAKVIVVSEVPLNVRRKPNLSADIITVRFPGEEVEIVGAFNSESQWTSIALPDKTTGYSMTQYLKEKE